jgi:PAS domain-containing protein
MSIGLSTPTTRRPPSEATTERTFDGLGLSEANLHIIDAIPTLAWCARPGGSNEFLNRRWYDYTGLSVQEGLGWGWKAAIHPDDLGRLMAKWETLSTSGESGESEARLRRFDGVYRWFLFRFEPPRDKAREVVE